MDVAKPGLTTLNYVLRRHFTSVADYQVWSNFSKKSPRQLFVRANSDRSSCMCGFVYFVQLCAIVHVGLGNTALDVISCKISISLTSHPGKWVLWWVIYLSKPYNVAKKQSWVCAFREWWKYSKLWFINLTVNNFSPQIGGKSSICHCGIVRKLYPFDSNLFTFLSRFSSKKP